MMISHEHGFSGKYQPICFIVKQNQYTLVSGNTVSDATPQVTPFTLMGFMRGIQDAGLTAGTVALAACSFTIDHSHKSDGSIDPFGLRLIRAMARSILSR
jgi:hypothetical protein